MESKQTYLRDIRDAIKGKERSMAGVSGNDEAKYLKDIADAIRENGGGGGSAGVTDVKVNGSSVVTDKVANITETDRKVKQTPVDTGIFNLLLANSYGDFEETAGAKKVGDLGYNVATKTMTNPGVYAATAKDETTNTDYHAELTPDDVELYSQNQSQKPNTWDGTNTSLKAALAAAKFDDILVINVSSQSSDDFSNVASWWYETFNFTDSSSDQDVGTLVYLDKSYSDIMTYVIADKPIAVNYMGALYTDYTVVNTQGGGRAILFSTPLSGVEIDSQKLYGTIQHIKILEPTT